MRYVVSLHMDDDGEFFCCLHNRDTGELLESSESVDNLEEALEMFAKTQREWYEKYGVPANERGVWRVIVNLELW